MITVRVRILLTNSLSELKHNSFVAKGIYKTVSKSLKLVVFPRIFPLFEAVITSISHEIMVNRSNRFCSILTDGT